MCTAPPLARLVIADEDLLAVVRKYGIGTAPRVLAEVKRAIG